jgi:DNA-binding CsgD family transcriptional regulator
VGWYDGTVADADAASAQAVALIGRDAEMAIGRETIAAGRGIVVAGAAGVGKTRFASELAEHFNGGYKRVRIAATRSAASIPLGAVGVLVPPGASSDVLTLNAIAAALRSDGRPVAMFVDDAHLLDDASAALVHRLALDGSAVVVTVRTGEAVPDPVRALWKDEHCRRLELQALSRDETARLVQEMLPGAADEAVVERCWELGRGNPMFTRELLRSGIESGQLHRVRGTWTWPGRFRPGAALGDLIAERFAGFTAPERELLALVAFGEPLERDVAMTMRGPVALEALAQGGLVAVDDATVRLAHPLYGEVVRHGAAAPTVARLSAELALAHPDVLSDPAAELRRIVWYMDGGHSLSANVLLQASLRAQVHDLELAVRLARAAIAAGGGTDATLRLADLLTNSRKHDQADALLAGLAKGDIDDRTRVAIAGIRATTFLWLRGRPADALAVVDRAAESLDDPSFVRELNGLRLQALLLEGRVDEIIRVVDEQLDAPELSNEARAGALIAGVSAWLAAGELHAAIRRCEAGLAIADSSSDAFPMHELLGYGITMSVLYLGDIDGAEARARELRNSSARTGGILRFLFSQVLGRVSMMRGRYALAVQAFQEASALVEVSPDLVAWNLGLLAGAYALVGDVAAGERSLDEASDLTASRMFAVDRERATALLAAARGERSHAAALSVEAADRALALGQRLPALMCLHDAAMFGAAREAFDRFDKFDGFPGRLFGAMRSHVAAIASADGERFEAASSEFEAMGCDRWAAEAATGGAAAFAEDGSRSRATRLAERARLLAQRLDTGVVDLETLQALATLTAREREIAGMAARGSTDREIGEALGISVRTVEAHLHRAYNKLGITSRTELSAYVLDY